MNSGDERKVLRTPPADNAQIRIVAAPGGDVEDVDWSDPSLAVPYADIREEGEWLMVTGAERALIVRLAASCPRLDDAQLTRAIFQGLITSADKIYHLERLGPEQYRCAPAGSSPYVIEIEDEIMKPLISGAEAKRYEEPETDTYLLFPYARDARGNMRLVGEDTMRREFPKAWAYLTSWEAALRSRERGAFDDENWWRFGRNQNLDKQDIEKLIVAQTVPDMRVCADSSADKYLNNVRVNGILPAPETDLFYLLGVLNSALVSFVFRRIAKPKRGEYFEANRQFIAPLPIPNASPEEQSEIAAMARALQLGWTRRRELLAAAQERLSVLARAHHDQRWLWPTLPTIADLEEAAPGTLTMTCERADWAKRELEEAVTERIEMLQAALDGGATLEADFHDGELVMHAGGRRLLDRIYLDHDKGRLTERYWRFLLLSQNWRNASSLAEELRGPPAEPGGPAARQFIERVDELAQQVADIAARDRAINESLFTLYNLTEAERFLVETDRLGRR